MNARPGRLPPGYKTGFLESERELVDCLRRQFNDGYSIEVMWRRLVRLEMFWKEGRLVVTDVLYQRFHE
jgi:hypothetical protein